MTLPTYSTGTVSVSSAGTVVTGVGTIWSGVNVKEGDFISINNFPSVQVIEVTDVTHLKIRPWANATQSAVAYVVDQNFSGRVVGVAAAENVSTLVAALNTSGFYFFVDPAASVPDPSLGADGQYAFQATTGKLWLKTAGVWVFVGVYKGINPTGAWSGATAYNVNDIVSLSGSSYICILAHTNHTPPNATYWALIASIGATGSAGPAGAGYGGTSATSTAIATGSKTFTTQAGLAYLVSNRVRYASAANGANYMEGLITAYSGTSMTVNVLRVGGSGTLSDWNISLAGDPGSGDMLSTNNLSDVASATTSRANLGVDVATRTITGADTLVAGDRGKLILFNSTTAFTAAVTAAATLGDGWWCRFRNIGVGPISIDPNGSELVDGATTNVVGLSDSGELHCTGSAFYTVNRPASVLLGGLVASASATLDFTGLISSAYRRYVLSIEQMRPATDDTILYLRAGTGPTPTIQSTSYGYSSRTQLEGAGVDNGSGAGLDNITSLIFLGRIGAGQGISNTSGHGASGHIEFISTGLGDFVYFTWSITIGRTADGFAVMTTGGGYWKGGTDITAVRLGMSSGNIASGQARLYGYRR